MKCVTMSQSFEINIPREIFNDKMDLLSYIKGCSTVRTDTYSKIVQSHKIVIKHQFTYDTVTVSIGKDTEEITYYLSPPLEFGHFTAVMNELQEFIPNFSSRESETYFVADEDENVFNILESNKFVEDEKIKNVFSIIDKNNNVFMIDVPNQKEARKEQKYVLRSNLSNPKQFFTAELIEKYAQRFIHLFDK